MDKRFQNDIIVKSIWIRCHKQMTWDNMITKNGRTQDAERVVKSHVTQVLRMMNIPYTEASSQRHGDIIIDSRIILELKKTDSNTIMLNDTLPSQGAYYLIFQTKQKRILLFNGNVFDPFSKYENFKKTLRHVEELYKTNYSIPDDYPIRTYIRPNFSVNIKHIINKTL